MAGQGKIAAIANREGVDTQALLAEATVGLRRAGAKVAGVLAENSDLEGICSAGVLRDIGSGNRYSIGLDEPPVGKTCHLDVKGLDDACADLLDQITPADVVIISKFGKMEATQQGLWAAFAAALANGKPLLTTVSPRHMEAWKQFAPTISWLDGDGASVERWWQTVKP